MRKSPHGQQHLLFRYKYPPSLLRSYGVTSDAMNRFVTTQGAFTGTRGSGSIGTNSTQGTYITYDAAGNRATSQDTHGTATYTYTEDGYLSQMTMSGVVRATYYRDAMGRVKSYYEYNSAGSNMFEDVVTYDNKSQILTDTQYLNRVDGSQVDTVTTYSYNLQSTTQHGVYNGTYEDGIVTDMRVSTTATPLGGSATTTLSDTHYDIAWWDAPVHSITYYNPTYTVGQSTDEWKLTYGYDWQGNLTGAYVPGTTDQQVSLTYNMDNEIVTRDQKVGSNGNNDVHEMHYYFNGTPIGDISNNGMGSDTDYVMSITQRYAVPGTVRSRAGRRRPRRTRTSTRVTIR